MKKILASGAVLIVMGATVWGVFAFDTHRPVLTLASSLPCSSGHAVLALSDKKHAEDAGLWASEITKVTEHEQLPCSFIASSPTRVQIDEFFGQSPSWVYIGGHFRNGRFFNGDDEDRSPSDDKIALTLDSDSVSVTINDEKHVLKKGVDFHLHEAAEVVFWGGCSIHKIPKDVTAFRELFRNGDHYPVFVGWSDFTGWQALHVIMGGFGNEPPMPKKDFFDRIEGIPVSEQALIDGWLGAGAETSWGNNSRIPDSLSIIDTLGREWVVVDGEVRLSGRTF